MTIHWKGLYDPTIGPPPPRNSHQDRPTLLVTWWCSSLCLFIIVSRVVGRFARTMKIFNDDKWMAATAIPLMIRMGLIHAVLVLGTNNADTTGMTEEEVRKRTLGSKLVLAARVWYAVFIWSQKFCITEFYKRLTVHVWDRHYEIGLKVLRWSLLVTFAAAVISIFAECRPSYKLWQVKPDPGPQCRVSYVPLVSLGSLNVFTDLLLVIFPIPAICRSGMRTRTKFHMIFLFSLSLLPVATTLYRVPSIIRLQGKYSQAYRTLWASIESLAACVCANAVILNSYARDRGPKKKKFRAPSDGEDAMDRRSVMLGNLYWGSDEDLARDVGMGIDADMLSLAGRSSRSSGFPSPVAFKAPTYNRPDLPRYNDKDQTPPSTPPKKEGPEMELGGEPRELPAPERAHSNRGRRVSFYDVGGLLGERRESSGSESGTTTVVKGGEGGQMMLNDVGGLLGGQR
ncbi:uncharacterized protein LAJ45_04602 [Morchella importuna]|uniref:uncharacterized protein n=1 Tax=Morchella importuna TaxID=1174673 RepID=UPI001E8D52A3|nr:uncharacterized protein LAJ45_04602 [Morchella importuna]KAH8151399.1 hypothetical protein LAJ45_04602 [Morchella importuna]